MFSPAEARFVWLSEAIVSSRKFEHKNTSIFGLKGKFLTQKQTFLETFV